MFSSLATIAYAVFNHSELVCVALLEKVVLDKVWKLVSSVISISLVMCITPSIPQAVI